MRRALLTRRAASIPKDIRDKLFSGWDVLGCFSVLTGKQYDVIVCAFEEQTQREIEWVDDARVLLRKGGKFIRTG